MKGVKMNDLLLIDNDNGIMENHISIEVYKNDKFIHTKKCTAIELVSFLGLLFLNCETKKEQRKYKYIIFMAGGTDDIGTIEYSKDNGFFIFTLD